MDISVSGGQPPEALKCRTSILRASKLRSSAHIRTPSRLRHLRRLSTSVPIHVTPARLLKKERSARTKQNRAHTLWPERHRKQDTVQTHQKAIFGIRAQKNSCAAFSRLTKRSPQTWQVPYENFVGAFVGGQFQLQYLQCQDDHLGIYSVTALNGRSFEAQAFSLSGLSERLLQARKRRMKRLHRSKNFVCEIEQAGKKFFVASVKRSDAEWKNLINHESPKVVPDRLNHESWTENFPRLTEANCDEGGYPTATFTRCRRENCCSDSTSGQGIESVFSRSQSSLDSPSSYSTHSIYHEVANYDSTATCEESMTWAKVASKGIDCIKKSKTRKGIKQRQKRLRKRNGDEGVPVVGKV